MMQGFAFAASQIMPLAVRTGLFVSLATVYKPVRTQGPTGNYIGTLTAVANLISIPCMDAPESIGRPTATEVKEMPNVIAEAFRHVLLAGYYPLIGNVAAGSGWQVDIDGTRYDLLGAESDSQRTQTRLRLQKVTVTTP